MTREEVYDACLSSIEKSNILLLEAATGLGKSKVSIDIVNHLVDTKYKEKQVSMLLLVAKKVHKQTWKEEFTKWGGIKTNVIIECYESLRKYEYKHFDIIVMDEMHHIKSDARLELLSTLNYKYLIGLSATIPLNLKRYFQYRYHAQTVSCDIIEAIEDNVLAEPEIILLPLQLNNTIDSEIIEINPKAKGQIYKGTFNNIWKFRKMKVHAIIKCTEKQKLQDINTIILTRKNLYERSRQDFHRNNWLFACGERLKYLANLKNHIVRQILHKLYSERTITFCKTIDQAEQLGEHCIHSKNKNADITYNQFNNKEINHITAVNILNENANLIDCKYAIFANLSSSEIIIPQRLGRAMRHKHPVIIIPYYKGTREEEIVEEMFKNYNQNFIRTINYVNEI